ncbi:zinc-binding dehydrogenase [Streptacidiphilus rugosus]|uniref:zinc-binding dehydrogenase n=1 Tax=Streptacidiphilus rugosus TaxID=405783 RepID=UPI0005685D9D|nr:zinc-binding dehydrogenase [Streptacidiphilus rugosus]
MASRITAPARRGDRSAISRGGTGRSFTSGRWTALDAFDIGRRGLTVVGPLGVAFAKPHADQRADAEKALGAVTAGTLRPEVHAVLPLERAAEAHAALEDRRSVGAVLLRP